MKFTILVDNYVNSDKLRAEHGLSILIEADNEKILFDCGQSDLLLHNAKILGIDLNQLTKIIVSHAHYDHTGGLLPLLKYLNREIDVYAHTSIFEEKFNEGKDFNGNKQMKYIGIPEKSNIYEKNGASFNLSKYPVKIGNIAWISGEIPRYNNVKPEDSFFMKENNRFTNDPVLDDISIFIDFKETLIIITGCAHSGISNILKKSKDMDFKNKDAVVIGGFHLAKKDKSYVENIIDEFNKYNVRLVVPMHCTGRGQSYQLKNSLGNKCVLSSVGKVLEF